MAKCEDCGHDPCDCDMIRWAHEQRYGDDEIEEDEDTFCSQCGDPLHVTTDGVYCQWCDMGFD